MGNDNLNRTYKDSVFRLLFNDKEKLIELYNAIFDTSYGPTTKLEFTTIEEAIFKTMKNDISFILEDTFVVLAEHQSTINGNMPTRDLIYFTTMLQRIISVEELYHQKTMKLPRPSFVVLYNGKEETEDFYTMDLSDSFKGEGENSLQLTVKVYNINDGRNTEVLKKCKTLLEYSRFVALIRQRARQEALTDAAMAEVLKKCIEEGILVEFLERYGTEVIGMLYKELTQEEAMEISKQDGYEEGREAGKKEGREAGKKEGREAGKKEGILEKAIDTAQKMKTQGIELEVIAGCTGLSIDKVRDL